MVNAAITMRPRRRMRAIAAALGAAVLVLAVTPAAAKTISAPVNAKVVKPLTLTRVQDLNLGSVVLGPGTWSGARLSLSRTGQLTCPARLTCIGTPSVAIYNVSGSRQQPLKVSAPNVRLVNQGDPSKTLTMTVDSPGTVNLPNSGNKGVDFPLGGAIMIDSTTAGGTYVGTFNVTVDY